MRANPTAIGLFMLGALGIAVAGTAILAGNTWFQRRTTFVSFFSESVNGLEVGAPVKFQGAPVGSVTQMLIQIDQRDKTFQVPVVYKIDVTQLRTQRGSFVDLENPAVLRQQITDGLRARLQMESLVTGQLYVELSYNPEAAPPDLESRATKWPEVPTTPSLMAALGTGAGSVVADVMKVLFQVNEMLAEIDMPQINAAVVASAQSIQRLVNAPEIRSALSEVPAMSAQVTRTMAAVETLAGRADTAIGPITIHLEGATKEMNATLQSLRRTIDETHGLLSSDSRLGFGLEAALASMRDAAEALRLLATSLQQNPDMLLRGKKPPDK
jgi:paraquat-inducible protein B